MTTTTREVPTRTVTFDGYEIETSYPRSKVRKALRRAKIVGPCEASKATMVPVSIICLWCRMAGIEYSIPRRQKRLSTNDVERIKHYIGIGHAVKDVALWYGYTENELLQRLSRE